MFMRSSHQLQWNFRLFMLHCAVFLESSLPSTAGEHLGSAQLGIVWKLGATMNTQGHIFWEHMCAFLLRIHLGGSSMSQRIHIDSCGQLCPMVFWASVPIAPFQQCRIPVALGAVFDSSLLLPPLQGAFTAVLSVCQFFVYETASHGLQVLLILLI